jgi:hypothetical protein
MVPGGVGAASVVALPFHLSIPQATAAHGYEVTAVSNFVFTPTASAAGGKTIAASDVGVGITAISSTSGPNSAMTISAGFDYDPATVNGTNGSSPYTGAVNGRATLSDLLPGRIVLKIIPAGLLTGGTAALSLTVKMAAQPQFLTPGGFSGTVTLVATPSH